MYILSIIFFIAVVDSQTSGKAQCTYHLYYSSTELNSVSCSDGDNGIITKWKYQNLQSMFPYVTAWDQLAWNNPKCGTCIKITYEGKQIFITALDQCGKPNRDSENAHFDIAPGAFDQLFGDQGYQKGTMYADWQIANDSKCKGNPKYSGQSLFFYNLLVIILMNILLFV